MNKKILHPLLCLTLTGILIFSCDKADENDLTSDKILVDLEGTTVSDSLNVYLKEGTLERTSSIYFHNERDAALLIIESTAPWTAETDADWISLATASGDAGTTGVIAGALKNETIPRSAEITITSGENTHKIAVQQQGAAIISLNVDDISFNLILVKGGTFSLGDDDLFGSTPAYSATVSDYYICETEVTNGLWNALMNNLPYDNLDEFEGHNEYEKPNYPLSAATYNEISESFLPTLNALTGLNFRLPTEAEWEYAAMGGHQRDTEVTFDYAGSNELDEVGWYDWNSDYEKHPVKQKQPNVLGLYDMSGNVSEWCSDWYTYYYNTEETDNPDGPDTGEERVVRGGNYTSSVQFNVGECGIKYRSYLVPGCYNGCWGDTGDPDEPICFRCQAVGFRLVLEP